MGGIVISGTGVFTPKHAVSNDALVESYNAHSEAWNNEHAAEIAAGTLAAREMSSSAFIEKASGIKNRYLMDGKGPTEVGRMRPYLAEGAPDNLMGTPVQVQMALAAAKTALEEANLNGEDIDLVIISASVWERFIPSMATELQSILGAKGFAFDMSMACSSATFGISTATDALLSGMANKALVVTAEYLSPLLNFEERDGHFIFGDAAVAMVLERETETTSKNAFRINSRKLFTEYSTNIQAGFGSRAMIERDKINDPAMRFVQNGRVVFKELLPKVIEIVQNQMAETGRKIEDFKRLWLHQANINMNIFATRKLLGRDPSQEDAPIILDDYANTAGAGCMIAFHKYKSDFVKGDLGLICSFGASYSAGYIEVERL
ncbi:beta-ketoacyl-ACP synthase III [Kordiimonas pumila]|uniref:Beta-ketoacyl-ACP synthase III n=1 Tax=Kordiimonas pumila TaxID=2161677 RepID=A0ABV7DAF7_9PROT|nr:beta-ketoacyl-ACP synthase III [Kordiimonas pumila]